MTGRSPGCYDKAVELLARRPHFRRELEHKLARRAFGAEEIEEACERLAGQGLLDDLECARQLAFSSLRRMGYGPLRVRAELRRKGAEEGVVDRVVAEEFGEGEFERAREVALTWLSRRELDRAKLARHLERKGYPADTIAKVLADDDVRTHDSPENP